MNGPHIEVHFVSNGDVVTQFNYEEKYDLLIKFYESVKDLSIKTVLKYGNDLGILMVRMAVLRGIIPCENITFHFNGEIIRMDKNARISHWPLGFCDFQDKLYKEMFNTRSRSRKNENMAS